MAVTVTLTWTNPSVEALNQRVEADEGSGFAKIADVAIQPDHTSATVYTYAYTPSNTETQNISYRIVTEGASSEEIGNVITLSVPVANAVEPVGDLSGEVTET